MKHYKNLIIAFCAIVVLGIPWMISSYPISTRFIDNIFSYIGNNYTAVFFQQGITTSQLHKKYDIVSKKKDQPKIKIMIVPGHEPNFGGTSHAGVNERDLTVELSNHMKGFFENNPHYEVIVSRTKDAWNPILDQYFKDNWEEIITFVKNSKADMIRLVNNGSVQKITNGVPHTNAPQNVALRLFGINKWNNENHVDIAIHVHFNNYPRKNLKSPGDYTGFAIYVPESQYSNSTTTRMIADSVFNRLSKYNAVSNLSKENVGVVEEQDLIAIGSYNTLNIPSMLIEYGYIYESQFLDPDVRGSVLKDLAFQTYLGVQDFFGSGNDVSLAYDTLILPHFWKEDITTNSADKAGTLALQSAFIVDGVYPPNNKTKNDCPRTGMFGPCTLASLNLFQDKHGIKNEKNIVGQKTKSVLNTLYSVQVK